MAHDVFISYSSEDKAVADAACATLEKRRIRCWVAPRDVPAGVSWASALVEAIRGSRVLVLILSEGSNSSAQVIREVDEAVGDGIPVLPLRIDDVEPSEEMRFYIKSVHWLDAVSPPMQRHLDHLTDSVEALLSVGEDPASPASATAVTRTRAALPQKRPARRTWVIGALAAAAALAIGAGGWLITSLTGEQDEAQQGANSSTSAPENATSTTTAPDGSAASGSLDWYHNPETDHDYALTGTAMTWDAVEALAEQQGGHLAAINDDAEARWLSSVFGRGGVVSPRGESGARYWIGLLRATTGEFRWTSGDPLTFTRWCLGEPTETYGGYDTDVANFDEDAGCWLMQSRFLELAGMIEVEEEPNSAAPGQGRADGA